MASYLCIDQLTQAIYKDTYFDIMPNIQVLLGVSRNTGVCINVHYMYMCVQLTSELFILLVNVIFGDAFFCNLRMKG